MALFPCSLFAVHARKLTQQRHLLRRELGPSAAVVADPVVRTGRPFDASACAVTISSRLAI
ncbi:hypothetical protein [Streptomyces sp. NPDC059819]